ncbi:hypothetical protein BPTFM16_00479 [Altererythrobacter insulae]|nr:hypothetical protein BPTFM16_00479 [Altererythrobacter insulae]
MNTAFRINTTALLIAFTLALTGCFMSPGKFASELVLEENGAFTFTYEGEIFFLGLSDLAKLESATEEFEAEDCFTDEYDLRECTEAEIAEQRADWDATSQERAEKKQKDAQEMAQMMGGIDPTDPEAATQLQELLLRHKGWEHVEAKGNGVFDVRYSARGNLSHDFMFPVIEGFPAGAAFVEIILRDGNVVRVNAPGFSAQDQSNPMSSMMGGMMGIAALGQLSEGSEGMPGLPSMEGTFTIVTEGDIRANNTDEGASLSARGEVLSWNIDGSTQSAPTALIKLAD